MENEPIEIEITGGKVLIDGEDLPFVRDRRWHVTWRRSRGYARRAQHDRSAFTWTYMHRMILGFPAGEVHHINGDGLDNRRSNLEVMCKGLHSAHRPKRAKTSSWFRGVCRYRGVWLTRMRLAGRQRSKSNISEVGAALVYDRWSRRAWGKQAPVNFSHFLSAKLLIDLILAQRGFFRMIFEKFSSLTERRMVACLADKANRFTGTGAVRVREVPTGRWRCVRLDSVLAVEADGHWFVRDDIYPERVQNVA